MVEVSTGDKRVPLSHTKRMGAKRGANNRTNRGDTSRPEGGSNGEFIAACERYFLKYR